LLEAAAQLVSRPEDYLLILLGEKNCPDLSLLIQAFSEKGYKFFGGVFPGIIHDTSKSEEGAILKVLPAATQLYCIKGLDKEGISLPDFPLDSNLQTRQTAFILVDGLTANISEFLFRIQNQLGHRVDFVGGGAGSISLEQKPCLFSNEGVFQDAALLGLVPLHISLGVSHGWEKIMGPIVATKTHKNVICELNWENAFEVYKEVVEKDGGQSIHAENFFDIAKAYPFGLSKEGEEDIVRDPIMVNENGELICVGEVPENSVLNILKGRPESLISSASGAATNALKGLGERPIWPLVVDCISRVLFLQEEFEKELEAIKLPSLPFLIAR